MKTVNSLVLISKEQRAHILKIDARHPGRSSARAVRLGFEFMHTPLRDYALITFCLDGTIRYANETAEARSDRLQWDPAGEEVPVALDQDFHDAAVKHFTAIGLKPLIGFSLCLWYGLMAYHCQIKSLREAIWRNYPRRADDLMATLLNDGKTFAGQAYLAGTAGGRTRCESCRYYGRDRKTKKGELKDNECHKWGELMGGLKGPVFPPSALACKFHEELILE